MRKLKAVLDCVNLTVAEAIELAEQGYDVEIHDGHWAYLYAQA